MDMKQPFFSWNAVINHKTWQDSLGHMIRKIMWKFNPIPSRNVGGVALTRNRRTYGRKDRRRKWRKGTLPYVAHKKLEKKQLFFLRIVHYT